MRKINGKVEGPLIIQENTVCQGMITRGVTLRSGVTLILYGMITGDLEMEPGSSAEVHGIINGTLRNNSADVVICGCVDAVEDTNPDMPTRIADGAVVRNR